jgi:hypothetical protein
MTTIRAPLYQPQYGTVVGQTAIVTPTRNSLLWAGVAEAVAAAEPLALFDGGGITMSVELWRATIDNRLVEDISEHLVDGSVDLNLDRDIKLAASFTLRNPGVITPYTDYLAPFIRLEYDDGADDVYQQVGLFATKVAPGRYTVEDSVATFEGMDLTSILATAYYPNTNNTPAATVLTTEIAGAITNGGITRQNIPVSSVTTPVAQSWKIGSSRLQKVNTLLDQLGWYHLGMDLDGKVSTPGAPQNLQSIEPWRELTDSDLLAPPDVQPTGLEIANVVLVVNDDPASAPLSSLATNADPHSPTSTVSIGRSIMRLVTVQGSTTQTALDALAARILAESRTYYRTCKVTILHDPTALNPHQTVRLTLTGKMESLSGLWWVRTASTGLTPDKPTTLELNQVTSDLVVGNI